MIRKTKPKILFILTLPPPFHGANISNRTLWNSRVRQTFDCTLLNISDKRDINNLGRLDFINVTLALKNLLDLVRLLHRQAFDLVYILVSQNNMGFLRDGLFILLVKALSKQSKVVMHLRGSFFKRFYLGTNGFMKRFIDFTFKKVDSAIVLGESLKPIFADWIQDVHVVPNGTDIRFPTNGPHKKTGMQANGHMTVLFLSNLMKSKGVIDVVKSAVYVSKRYPGVTYKIAGMWGHDLFFDITPDELQNDVMDIIKSNGLDHVVQFLGVVTGKAKEKLLCDSHILVLPSYYPYEGHPRSLIEAMAAGCPVISTRIGAIPDTVIDNETGFLIDSQNPEMLADRVIRLIEDEPLRKRMGMAARKRYEQFYTKDRFIENMIGVFRRMMTR